MFTLSTALTRLLSGRTVSGPAVAPAVPPADWRRAAVTLMHSPDAALLAMSDAEFTALGAALGLDVETAPELAAVEAQAACPHCGHAAPELPATGQGVA